MPGLAVSSSVRESSPRVLVQSTKYIRPYCKVDTVYFTNVMNG